MFSGTYFWQCYNHKVFRRSNLGIICLILNIPSCSLAPVCKFSSALNFKEIKPQATRCSLSIFAFVILYLLHCGFPFSNTVQDEFGLHCKFSNSALPDLTEKVISLFQEGLNILHCAAINNHTEIVDYIVNDLQMKELDKDDLVCNLHKTIVWQISFCMHYMWLPEPLFLCFSQDTEHLHWQQSTGVLRCYRCSWSHTTWPPWSPTRCARGLICAILLHLFPSIWLFMLTCALSAHFSVTPARKLKVKHSLMQAVSLPPFCQRGDTPLHLAARNGHLDVVQLLLQSFDTRDEVNMVDNQCKHPLYHGLVCDSVSSAANPLLDAGSTWDQLRWIKHLPVSIMTHLAFWIELWQVTGKLNMINVFLCISTDVA